MANVYETARRLLEVAFKERWEASTPAVFGEELVPEGESYGDPAQFNLLLAAAGTYQYEAGASEASAELDGSPLQPGARFAAAAGATVALFGSEGAEVTGSVRQVLAPSEATVALQWENVPFEQPRSGVWARVTVLFGEGRQASLGSRPLEFVAGVVVVQVFVPKGSGTRLSAALADHAAACLRYTQLSGDGVVVHAEAPSGAGVGERADHHQQNVRVAFRAQHTAAVAA